MRSFTALTAGIDARADAGAGVGTGTRYPRSAEEGLIFFLMLSALASCDHVADQRVDAS